MPERPDLRKIATDIKDALASYPREALVDILTYVFQAYVVEGAPVVHAPQAERLQELEGLPFAELVQALQVRLDVPELALFEVQGTRVTIRLGGELHPIALGADQRRAAQAPLPASGPPAPAPAAAPAPARPAAQPAPAAATPAATAPRPTRGLSVNPGARPPAAAPQAAAPPAAGQPARPPAAPADDPGDDDAASKRFKLLEID
jgi:hypothetical protein